MIYKMIENWAIDGLDHLERLTGKEPVVQVTSCGVFIQVRYLDFIKITANLIHF